MAYCRAQLRQFFRIDIFDTPGKLPVGGTVDTGQYRRQFPAIVEIETSLQRDENRPCSCDMSISSHRLFSCYHRDHDVERP